MFNNKAISQGFWSSVNAALVLSFMYILFMIIPNPPKYISFILIIGIPLVSVIVSILSTIFVIIPSVILLKKINLDKKVPIVIVGILIGILIWFLLDVSIKTIFVTVFYSMICSFSFMTGYDKYRKNDKIE